MSTLDRALRKTLADTIIKARDVAEEAARDAIRRLGVIEDEPPAYLSTEQKTLRVRLRAHARSLGDGWNSEKRKLQSTQHLETEAAYEIWHRMLFGRFLVERGLLIHPDLGEPIAPSELADLAREEGEADQWALVERFAAPSLPAVFKPDDPVLAMTLDPALARRLRDLVTGLPTEVFTADDALGWTYQFWRTSEKEAVNKAGGKVGPHEVPAVTQLFTERYMVQFLLHNTLGAWWAGRYLTANPDFARNAPDEQALRDACAIPGIGWDYLRFVRDSGGGLWRPAAGTFSEWPKTAAEITYCDPCCGSGHFLVEALLILAAMRQHEEALSAAEAARSVLTDNLHGLEIDGRCVQIAAFNVALAAWKFAGGPTALPQPHIAWVGAPPPMSRLEMAALGGSEPALREALELLYNQFEQAPVLGSLLEIGARDLLDADLRERGAAALAKLREVEPERSEGAVAAKGLLDAADLLGRRYVVLATNVPFLGRGRQGSELSKYIGQHFPEAKTDLATAMLQRMRSMVQDGGTISSVTPQNWLFLSSYKNMRGDLLDSLSLRLISALGSRAFESITGEVVNASLLVMSSSAPIPSNVFCGISVVEGKNAHSKSNLLQNEPIYILRQSDQKRNPDSRISLETSEENHSLLSEYAESGGGISTFDSPRFLMAFYELLRIPGQFLYCQSPPSSADLWSGRTNLLRWEHGCGALKHMMSEKKRLENYSSGIWEVWRRFLGRKGVCISLMNNLPATIYDGYAFDNNTGVVIPASGSSYEAVLAYCLSPDYNRNIRQIDKKMNVTSGTLVKVPFDFEKWATWAKERYASGIPEPYSDDPTQWLFHGHPAFAENGTQLHVALARVAGYRWPAETDMKMQVSGLARERIALAAKLGSGDVDGLLPLHAIGTERPLADRLRLLLAAAYGRPLTPAQEADLVRAADIKFDKKEARDLSLEGWLRDRAFRQHCVLFQHRPFLWHVWDGVKDGFSAFLHYHRLDYAKLEKLTFTLLGGWIAHARSEGRTAHEERGLQLQQKLRAILDGEAPYDIFVRWKPLRQQPFGWRPDVEDGVRLNIRPFMLAEVLREQPRIDWKKDRGADVSSAPWFHLGLAYGGKEGDRINDHHLALSEKQAAQREAKAS